MIRVEKENSAKFPPEVNLYLVGFMGTGKTTVGRSLACKLGYEFFDSDHEIEIHAGMPVRDIFERDGEAAFRGYEREFIENGHPRARCVVACGGGLVTQAGMIDLLKSRGVVICLCATIQTILARTEKNRARPLLNVEDPEKRIRELLAEREPFYKRAGAMVLTDNRGLSDIVAHISRIYLREAEEFIRRQPPRTISRPPPDFSKP